MTQGARRLHCSMRSRLCSAPSGTSESDAMPGDKIGVALSAMEACWPIQIEDKVTRHTYNSQRCGTLAELFLVDTRGGSIGKSQAEWLEEMVPGSPCLWKIIVTSAPLSVSELKETAAAGAGVFT